MTTNHQPSGACRICNNNSLNSLNLLYDDAGSWPRAAAHIIPLHRGLGLTLVNNREAVLRGLGALLYSLGGAPASSVRGSSGFSPG